MVLGNDSEGDPMQKQTSQAMVILQTRFKFEGMLSINFWKSKSFGSPFGMELNTMVLNSLV